MKAVWWLAALMYMAGIWYFSAQGSTPVPLASPWDKLVHLLEYTMLGVLLARATGRRHLAWVLAAWFGALDETHQAFVPGREAGIADWWFDLAGSWLGSQATPTRTPEQERA